MRKSQKEKCVYEFEKASIDELFMISGGSGTNKSGSNTVIIIRGNNNQININYNSSESKSDKSNYSGYYNSPKIEEAMNRYYEHH